MPTAPTHEGMSTDRLSEALPALVAVGDASLRADVEAALSRASLRPVARGEAGEDPLPVLAVVDTEAVDSLPSSAACESTRTR